MSSAWSRDYDIVVAGAGVAGVAAALECARAGLRTALVEKTILIGGLATAGLINIYLPLCDGRGHQVTFGIAEELLRLSIKYGPDNLPAGWRDGNKIGSSGRYRTFFSPASFVLALDETLVQAGVALWLDTVICQPVLRSNRVVGVEVENKNGRGMLRAQCVIDATGDADVAFRAGAPCMEADNWLSSWAIQVSGETACQAANQPEQGSLLEVIRLGGDNTGCNAPADIPKLRGTDAEHVTRFVLESRRLLREYYQNEHAHGGRTDRQRLFPVTLPAMAQFRTTRRIMGQETLTDGQYGQNFPTAIGLVADWRKPGYVWEIPYGTLLPERITGLIVAGRCISSEGDAWEVTRVIPPAALTGQVAGIAARLALRHQTTPDQLDVQSIQAELTWQGMPFHLQNVLDRQAS